MIDTSASKRYREASSKFNAKRYCQEMRNTREFGHAFVPMNHAQFLDRSASLYPDKEAVVETLLGREFRCSYRELDERTNRLANALLDLGIEKYDRIAYLMGNIHELLEGYLTSPKIGTILLPMNIRLTSDDFEYILNDSVARVLIFDPIYLSLIQKICDKVPVEHYIAIKADEPLSIGGGVEAIPYDHLLKESPQKRPQIDYLREISENDISELFYTSGTTGGPKGVMYTYREIYIHALEVIASWHIRESDRILHGVPLFHTNGWGTPQFLTVMGGIHIMFERFDPGRWLQIVEQERVTKCFMVGTMWNMIVNYLREHPDEKYDLSSIEWVLAGGATLSYGTARDVDEMLKKYGSKGYIITGYGATECCPIVSQAHTRDYTGEWIKPEFADLSEEEERRLRCRTGYPMIGVEVKIIDENGNKIKPDGVQIGNEWVRGNMVMRGYWRRPDKTREVFDEDGWFNIEDMCTIDKDGYMLLVDRSKDIIISGGENIPSVEVERVVKEHRGVSECAVIGVPDKKWGERVHAVVELKPGAKVSKEEIIEHCRDRLAHYKCPRSVEFAPIPRTGTGKLLKRTLREKYY